MTKHQTLREEYSIVAVWPSLPNPMVPAFRDRDGVLLGISIPLATPAKLTFAERINGHWVEVPKSRWPKGRR